MNALHLHQQLIRSTDIALMQFPHGFYRLGIGFVQSSELICFKRKAKSVASNAAQHVIKLRLQSKQTNEEHPTGCL